jgi:hypothetical protein
MSRAGPLECHRDGPSAGRRRSPGRKPGGCTWPGDLFDPHPRPSLARKRRTRSDVSADSAAGLKDGCLNLTCSKQRPFVVRQGAGRSASMTACRTTRAGLDPDPGCRSLRHCLLMAWWCSLGCSPSNTSSSLCSSARARTFTCSAGSTSDGSSPGLCSRRRRCCATHS